ncbi:ABC transporter permease [Paucibacter sp. R3-3]|uniref:ABC transporter permease n=1 Tax=Roseateles agri TaxID=3098619 RepID=A0ABU5DFK2_9BURK|nr:ABC transporter permease [Paucibacter sp. R3-3]MDY0745060.1 ABC transporter permease [Paucibacter sp. R3-3]
MLAYYLELGFRSLKSARALTVLVLLSIAMGVAACMTTLTVFHVLSGDPIPSKSKRLFNVQLDAQKMRDYVPNGEPDLQLTRFDAETLLRDKRGVRQVFMHGANSSIDPAASGKPDVQPFFASSRFTSADFFPVFEVPFLYGGGWTATEDDARARVAVISRELNERLFDGADSRGKTVRVRDKDFTIVGVLNDWRPAPHYFDMTLGTYAKPAQVYLPVETALELKFGHSGNMDCWDDTPGGDVMAVTAPCSWAQYWVELDTPQQAAAYLDYLNQYSAAQKQAGRFERPPNARLRPVMEWLLVRKAVPSDIELQVWLAFGFLAVCLTNAVGLLLAKCLRRSGEIGVRRALGASRSAIFCQFLVEAGSLGLAGGALGLLLTLAGLWAVRQNGSSYAALAQLDWAMFSTTFALAVGASLIAGLLPAWRACQITPALQLKVQ